MYLLNLENDLDTIQLSGDFILCGDFNCPDIDWQMMYDSTPSSA